MAKKVSSKSFKVSSKAINEGEWVGIGEEFGDPEPMILTRGYTDQYREEQQRRFRKVSEQYRNNERRIPDSIQRKIVAEVLIETVLLGVRDLIDDATDEDMTFEAFCAKLKDPDYRPLYDATLIAVNQVGKTSSEAVADDVKN